ncbi:hypothetical protein SAMN04488024_103231 [Pedobacter soli]|uniref:Uncharacterized protein n=2 Tax=Pedobacter soli TaxID=390242 RepID=A0A1G6Q561_9SPHI|nr:hypothetical protein SAMN04488024_103231 [Pedobacter soli]
MSHTKQIYKRLKNKMEIIAHYKRANDESYTITLGMKNELFTLHSFCFDGNNVFDEDNYKDESFSSYQEFDQLMTAVESSFPGININI